MENSKNNYPDKKFITGKFKPKCSKGMLLINLILDLCLIAATILFILEVIKLGNANLSIVIISAILIPVLDYIILLSPYQQYTENYYIEFKDEKTIDGFKLFYRKRELEVLYEIDKNGKIVFKNSDGTKCFAYKDGKRLSGLTKRRIINYFTAWLKDNNLLK